MKPDILAKRRAERSERIDAGECAAHETAFTCESTRHTRTGKIAFATLPD